MAGFRDQFGEQSDAYREKRASDENLGATANTARLGLDSSAASPQYTLADPAVSRARIVYHSRDLGLVLPSDVPNDQT